MRIPKTIIFLLFCSMLLVGRVVYLGQEPPKRDKFLIPEGYSGNLAVTFSVRGAPQLPLEDGYRVIMFDKTGVVKTSSEGMPGKLKDEYYFYSENSRRPLEPKELGGGFTEAPAARPEEFTFKFSVIPFERLVPDRK